MKEKSPTLSQKPPLKFEVLSSPPFFKFGWMLNPPAERGDTHYLTLTETDKLRLTAHPELLNSRIGLYFPCDLNHPLKCD